MRPKQNDSCVYSGLLAGDNVKTSVRITGLGYLSQNRSFKSDHQSGPFWTQLFVLM